MSAAAEGSMGRRALLGLLTLLAACGPAGSGLDPAGDLFEGLEVVVDPEGVVPFSTAPEALLPRVTRQGDRLSFEVPEGLVAGGFEAIARLPEGDVVVPVPAGERVVTLPEGTERAGLRAVFGPWRGPVVWAGESGQQGQGLGSPPEWRWAREPPWAPQTLETVSVDAAVSLLDPSGDDLSGRATLVLRPVVGLDTVTLRLRGEVSAVRDGSGADLAFAPAAGGLAITLPAPARAGSEVTIEVEWRTASLAWTRGGRAVAGASAELVYAGDGVAWFPHPADTPYGRVPMRLAIEAPGAFSVFTGGEEIASTPVGNGRVRHDTRLDRTLRAWPLLVAGRLVSAAAGPKLTLAALESAGPVLEPYASDLQAVLDFYEATFGPLPGDHVSLVQVPDAFAVGFSAPGRVLVPTVSWSEPPSTWSRFLLFHELSHAWWGHGSFVGDRLDAWLIEGLADYSAHRALEVVAGAEVARAHALEDRDLLVKLMAEGYGGQPGRDVPVRPDDPALLQDYVYYLKGQWVLRHLEWTLGRPVFDAGLGAYATATHFADTSTAAFEAAMEQASGADLGWYFEEWLEETGLPAVAYAPYLQRGAGGEIEVALGVTQRAGVSGDPERPFRLALPWRAIEPDGASRAFSACLTVGAGLVEPDGGRCLP